MSEGRRARAARRREPRTSRRCEAAPLGVAPATEALRRRRRSVGLIAALVGCTALGCGYGFAVGGPGLPEEIGAVYVPVFRNRSSEPEAGAIFAQALAEGLAREGRAAGPHAPARLEGDVLSLMASPAATTKEGKGVGIYRLSGTVRLRLLRDGVELCRREFTATEDYLPAQNLLELDASRRRAVSRLAERMMASAHREICPGL